MSRVEAARLADLTEASADSHRSKAAAVVLVTLFLLLALLAWRMVPHPVGPARTFGKYEGKAVTTAKGAESALQTALLISRTASAGNAFGPYTAGMVSDAEESLSGIQGTFDSIQPPDRHAAETGATLDAILGDALEHVRDVRIAARRGALSQLGTIAEPIASDVKKLETFQARHR